MFINDFRVMGQRASEKSEIATKTVVTSLERAVEVLRQSAISSSPYSALDPERELLKALGMFRHTKFARGAKFRNWVDSAFMRLGVRGQDYAWP